MDYLNFKHEAPLIETLQEVAEGLATEYESYDCECGFNDEDNMRIPHQSYDGFIPFTNGGFSISIPLELRHCEGSGKFPLNKEVERQMQASICEGNGAALGGFIEDNLTLLKGHFTGEEVEQSQTRANDMYLSGEWATTPIDYSTLYDKGLGEVAEALSDYEVEANTKCFWLEIRAMYFSEDNYRNESGEDEILFIGGVNLDYEYGRDKGLVVTFEKTYKTKYLTPHRIKVICEAMGATI